MVLTEQVQKVIRVAFTAVLMMAAALSAAQPSKAESLNLTFSNAPGNSTTYGSKVLLDARITGLRPADLDRSRLTYYQAEFPYSKFRRIDSLEPNSSTLVSMGIRPRVNTRYKVVLRVGGRPSATGKSPVVFVNPVRRGGRYTNTRSGLRYGVSTETYSRALLARWLKVPDRLRTVYYYLRCSGISGWRLQAARRIKTQVRGKSMTLTVPGFQFRNRQCSTRILYTVQMGSSKLPGYRRDGDDGAGQPNYPVRIYRTWVRVAGKSRISDRVARALRW